MADNVQVIYNGNVLSPPPFVSRTQNPIDYGKRWGFEDSISLKGSWYISGDTTGSISRLMNVFSGQFVRFQVNNVVAGNSFTVLDYPSIILDEVSFDSAKFFPNTYINYSVKLKSINVPSGIVEPSNEYSFSQNEDGTVNVSHKTSARGILTSGISALDNAKAFVQRFTGVNPFNPFFVSTGAGILLNQSETIDRLSATYSVSETYKYNTGENLSYTYVHTLDLDESKDLDYKTLNLSLNLQGSSIKSNLSALRTVAAGINAFQFIQDKYQISTGLLFLNNFGAAENSGSNTIQISANFISGAGSEYTGFFDYDLDFKWDKILDVRTFNINGKFSSKAPVEAKRTFLQNFKTSISNNFQGHLYNLAAGSYYNTNSSFNPSTRTLNPISKNFSMNENTGIADFSMNATFDDKDFLTNISETSFSLSFDGQRNLYEFKPSANIEGHYIIQDLQSLSRENAKISCNLNTTGNVSEGLSSASTLENHLAGRILNSNYFLIESGLNTGVFDASLNTAYFNSGSKFDLNPKFSYSDSNVRSIRPAGYKFGR